MQKSNRGIILWIGIGIFLLAIYALTPVLTPFFIAAGLAYLFDPIVNRLQWIKIPRTIGVILVFILIILLVLLLLLIVIPLLEEQVLLFIKKLPDAIIWAQQEVLPWLHDKFNVDIDLSVDNLRFMLSEHWKQAGGFMTMAWKTAFSSGMAIVSWMTTLLLIPVVLFYLLRDWHQVLQGVRDLLPRKAAPTVMRLFNECDEVLSAFLRGQFLVMMALGVLYTIGLEIIGLDLALLIGMISGLVSIVPYLGFIVGIVSSVIAVMMQFHDMTYLLYVLIVFVVANGIEASVLTPWLVGDKIGLHPVAVIFAVLAGGHLFGFVGILLALPAAAVCMVFLRYLRESYISSRLYHQGLKREMDS